LLMSNYTKNEKIIRNQEFSGERVRLSFSDTLQFRYQENLN
jgi:hypothetical protein